MKTIVKITGITMVLLFSLGFFYAGEYPVNTSKSVVKWNGKKVTGEHFGTIAVKNGSLQVNNGEITINRAKYDVRYGSGSFFQGLGDKMIYDDFTLDFSLLAERE